MRRITKLYYFSVEGETEQWYLEWLQKCINETHDAKHSVKFQIKVVQNPLSYVKKLPILDKTDVVHICDIESDGIEHVKYFQQILDNMRLAEKRGKKIKYKLAYSNFTFELWIILHKTDCRSSLTHRNQYLKYINQAYAEKFEHIEHYKQEKNFKRLLSQLSLENVKQAVYRAQNIRNYNREVGFVEQQYRKFTFYKENPSLSIDVHIENILQSCGLLK